MADLSSVRNAPMLEGVTQEELAELEAIAQLEKATTGERLFVRGDEARKFYIVNEGAFCLTLPLRRFDEVVELAVEEKGAGDSLGWSSIVAPHRSMYSGYCTADGSLFSFQHGDLARLMSSDQSLCSHISINLNRLIADRLRSLQSLWIEEIEQNTARVDHWVQSEIADHLRIALRPPPKEAAHGHRLFRRRRGRSPSPDH
ncbi:MAG: cyclic nucleotide-binding domain-containing protein [Deltaproteobacteria bacterium]|nr:cyclic nucleotide-binding domain-containing protein [Deltaproteobacteria bacterium]